ncbi:MAG: MBL fold metallo-hydrolase [Candidatus Nezhaarchaeales archaeon]
MELIPRSIEILILVEDYAGFTPLLGEHGLSALMTLYYDDDVRKVLFDVGGSGRALLVNVRDLKVSLSDVDVIVLSHRHYDHTGSLPKLVEVLKGKPLIAHPALTRPCFYISSKLIKLDVGLPTEARRALKEFELLLIKEPLEVAPGVWFLGEVERFYDDSYAVKNFKTIVSGNVVDDVIPDDSGLAIKMEDKVVVLTGCSHSGILNIVRQAKNVTGVSRAIIIGGLHLINVDDDVLNDVVNKLVVEGVEEVYVGHCTGLKGESELLKKFKGKMHKLHSGYKVRLSSRHVSR